jgi:hypothetical protein
VCWCLVVSFAGLKFVVVQEVVRAFHDLEQQQREWAGAAYLALHSMSRSFDIEHLELFCRLGASLMLRASYKRVLIASPTFDAALYWIN